MEGQHVTGTEGVHREDAEGRVPTGTPTVGSPDVLAALERAALICEEQARDFLSPQYATGQPLSSFNERFACDECARAIRAEIAILAALPTPESEK